MGMQVAGESVDAGFDGLCRLVAGCGAEIEESFAGMKMEQRDDGLRGDVLDASGGGDVRFGRAQKCAGDGGGGFSAEVAIPAREKPGGTGELGGAVRPLHGFVVCPAQNCIHEARG